MAILNFPANPGLNETYEENGIVYLGKAENLRITGQTSTSSQGAQINNYTADAEL